MFLKITIIISLLIQFVAVIISSLLLVGLIILRKRFSIQDKYELHRKQNEAEIISAIVRTEENERQRFAKELHDGLGPLISSVKMAISSLKRIKRSENEERIIENTEKLIDESIITLKEISNNLSSHVLNSFGLKKALQSLIIFFTVIIFLFSGCKPSAQKEGAENTGLKGYISLSGAFALYPITVIWADEFKKINPDIVIDISAGGAGKGMADALAQMVDLGMFSRGVTSQEVDLGVWYIALTKDAVIPTINTNNPFIKDLQTKGISKENLVKLFVKGEIKTWEELIGKPGKTAIHLFTRSDACGAAAMWGEYLGSNQEDLIGTGVFGDPGLADAIKNDIYGIGYNNVNYVYDIETRKKFQKLEVIPIDFNDNGILDSIEKIYDNLDQINDAIIKGVYPSPPGRDLYFVSKGKPEKIEVLAFMEWILTKGQAFVNKAGYVPLSEEKINQELAKLK